ncbi:MAG: TlpA family protein disulfide reductase [Actinobacteria bacterium]|nr:TlpA family protein disulfide reductase [Actinomycetota bacterium]
MRRRIKLALALSAALALTVIAVGCGSSSSGGGSTHPDYKKALAGAPAPLAKLYSEANQLLPGGKDALEKRVAALGYPAVVNVWASWCGPCRYEFPAFQNVAAKWGKRVGFIGVNSEDSESNAAEFLAEAPVPYPSYYDPDHQFAASLKTEGLPDTAFYNARGELVYKKLGQYAHPEEELEEDIRYYLMKGA